MPKATLLIKAVPSKYKEALGAIRRINGVVDAFPVYGRFDIIVSLRTDNYEKMIGVTADINKIEGIRSTETLLEA